MIAFPAGKPRDLPTPAVYQVLNQLPDGPVLSLPSYADTREAFRETDYLLFSTVHWRRIVNGAGRQDPPGHVATIDIASRFPASEAVDRLCDLGVRYVVLHSGRETRLKNAVREAQGKSDVKLLAEFGDDYLFGICDPA